MKKVSIILLLSLTCFISFMNAQNSVIDEGGYIAPYVKVVISDYSESNVRKFSISTKNIPNQISQLDNVRMKVFVQNNSQSVIDDSFCLEYFHRSGFSFTPSNCTKFFGGLGSVKIPPLGIGQSAIAQEDVSIPLDFNGPERFLSIGSHDIDFFLRKITNGVIKAKATLNFNIFVTKDSPKINCKTISKSEQIKTFPNPFTKSVTLDISEQEDFTFPITIKIYNNIGMLQDTYLFKERNSKILNYNNSKLSTGLYYYKLISHNKKIITGTLYRK